MKLGLSDKLKPKKKLVTRFLGSKAIILDPDTTKIHELNETASLIWRLVNRGSSLKKIIEGICATYKVSKKEAKEDTIEFLKKYLKTGMIAVK